MYISEHSGHHQAAIAIEKALFEKAPESRIKCIDAFRYTNPILERVLNGVYMRIIRKRPHVWGGMYDNPDVVRRTARLRDTITRMNMRKVKRLLDDFKPDSIACTQALPCSMVAAYKRRFGVPVNLVGVLTDYAPHSYWLDEQVDHYVVPSNDTAQKLAAKGVQEEKIRVLGTPVDPVFAKKNDTLTVKKRLGLDVNLKTVLVMGGTRGLGPSCDMIRSLLRSEQQFQIIFVAGVNKRLYNSVKEIAEDSVKKITCYSFANNIDKLMDASDIIVTKPGGITTAEALVKGLPMVIIGPLPGQEELNMKVLLKEELAVKADGDVGAVVDSLLKDKCMLEKMGARVRSFGKPDAAMDIAELLLN